MQENGEKERAAGYERGSWRVDRGKEREGGGGEGRITAGHAGEKESEQIRRNERRKSLEGGREEGEHGTVLWKNGEQDERGQATGSLTWTISLKMPVPPRDLGSKTSRGERISSLLHPGSGERPSFPRRREENFHIFHSRGSVLDRRCKKKKDRRRNEAL